MLNLIVAMYKEDSERHLVKCKQLELNACVLWVHVNLLELITKRKSEEEAAPIGLM